MSPVIKAADIVFSGTVTVTLTKGEGVSLPTVEGQAITLGTSRPRSPTRAVAPEQLAFTDANGDGVFEAQFVYLIPGDFSVGVVGPAGVNFSTNPASPAPVSVGNGKQVGVAFTLTSASARWPRIEAPSRISEGFGPRRPESQRVALGRAFAVPPGRSSPGGNHMRHAVVLGAFSRSACWRRLGPRPAAASSARASPSIKRVSASSSAWWPTPSRRTSRSSTRARRRSSPGWCPCQALPTLEVGSPLIFNFLDDSTQARFRLDWQNSCSGDGRGGAWWMTWPRRAPRRADPLRRAAAWWWCPSPRWGRMTRPSSRRPSPWRCATGWWTTGTI